MRTDRAATFIVYALVTLLAFPLASEVIVSRYRRWEASSLLATVRELHPGSATEAEARFALSHFHSLEDSATGQDSLSNRLEYQIYNTPEWIRSLAYHPRFIPVRLTLPWTLFEVDVDFRDALVARIKVVEMQDDQSGSPHPTSASVSLLSRQSEQSGRNPWGSLPEQFNGYAEYSRSTGQEGAGGSLNGFSCCHARFIMLDERASADQRSRSLNFQLHCLTSWLRCKDDRQILPQ